MNWLDCKGKEDINYLTLVKKERKQNSIPKNIRGIFMASKSFERLVSIIFFNSFVEMTLKVYGMC